jgi:hypothetical protein
VWVLDLVITAFGLASVRMVVSNIVVVKRKKATGIYAFFLFHFFICTNFKITQGN